MSLVAEERDRNISRVQELEASITELKHAAGVWRTLPSSGSCSPWPLLTSTIVSSMSSSVCTSELLSQEREADNAEPQSQSSGPSESEVALQESLNRLEEEKEALTSQYQAQVQYVLHC